MNPDAYVVIFTPDQKQALEEYIKTYKNSHCCSILERMGLEGDTYFADISSRIFCLCILELRKNRNHYLAERLEYLGKMQDGHFLGVLEEIKIEYSRFSAALV